MSMLVRDALGASQTVETLPSKGQAVAANSLPVTVASDQPPLQTTPPKVAATSRSSTVTTGGTAQDLMPANAARNGWCIQNQSTGDLRIRSKGSAGSNVATLDQNSLLLPAGAYYEAPHASPHAFSVIGATTGQAFFATEW